MEINKVTAFSRPLLYEVKTPTQSPTLALTSPQYSPPLDMHERVI